MIECSIGIMVYNEEANIRLLLESVFAQKLSFCVIRDILVISSGSSDKTNEIVEDFSSKAPGMRLIVQPERLGKASAINIFLKNSEQQVCVLINGDSILHSDAVEFLVKPFDSPDVGMTGARLIPLHHLNHFMNHISDFMWELHHEISLRVPKMGELVAFRKDLVQKIIEDTAVDEVCLECQTKKSGHKVVYVPKANIYIRTTDNLKDFILQRRRIATGHLWAGQVLGYTPSTRNMRLILQLTFKKLVRNPEVVLFILAAAFFECLSRTLGWYDYYIRQRNPYIWKISLSTKSRLNIF